jgi:exodeoxyribonuclease V
MSTDKITDKSADRNLTRKDLSKDQAEVYDAIVDWTDDPHADGPALDFDQPASASILTVGGYAGTGKTSLLGVFARETDRLVAYITYTGRASSVLHRKLRACGVATTTMTRPPNDDYCDERWHDDTLGEDDGPCFIGTIHRLLYYPIIDEKTEELLGWTKRDKLDRNYTLIVVDEASMVSDDILEDLQRHQVPILAVGDHGQLPPVMASGDLMRNPDLRLEKIHRQAEKNPIIAFSKVVRETGVLDEDFADDTHVVFASKNNIEAVLERAYKAPPLDVGLMCWKNRTRIKLNQTARRALKFKGTPSKGELVLCLKNAAPIYNGMRGVLANNGALEGWLLSADVAFPEEGLEPTPRVMCAAQFNRERPFQTIDELQAAGVHVERFSEAGHPFDFGYCLTVHKAQGSQFPQAIFYVDRRMASHDEEWRRFAYTAVTRASERLTVLL